MNRYITDAEHHILHRDTCELKPINLAEQVNVGCHCEDKYALIAAKKLFSDIEPCSKCMSTTP